MGLNFGSLAFIAFAILVLELRLFRQPWTLNHIVGNAIVVISFGFLMAARIQLGRSFSATAKTHKLVTSGLYSFMLHPIYLFGSTLLLGLVIISGKPWTLLAFLVIIPMQVHACRIEAEMLTERFGHAYEEYRKSTWIAKLKALFR